MYDCGVPIPDSALPELPTVSVADVLGLPELVAGGPEIVAGGAGLERPVRWAHVVAGTAAISLLDGGELILTTGTGWSQESGPLGELAEALMRTEPAAVVFELGPRFPETPAPLARACESHGVPLIVLHREVRFVQLTQRIHQRVLAAQNEALEARTEVHAMLTELGLNRSPVDYVIERLANTLDAAVVLEDSAGGVVAWAGQDDPEVILAAWQPDRRSAERARADTGRREQAASTGRDRLPGRLPGSDGGDSGEASGPTGADGATGADSLTGTGGATGTGGLTGTSGPAGTDDPEATWDQVPVEAQGKRWGRLTALPGPAHPAGRRTVLELGAFALALGRLADTDGEQWLRESSKRMFDALLGGRFRRDAEIAAQLAAAGFPIAGRVVAGATLTSTGDFGAHDGLERAILETALRRAIAPDGRALIAPDPRGGRGSGPDPAARPERTGDRAPELLVLLSFPGGDPRLAQDSLAPGSSAPPLAARLARELDMLLPATTPADWRAHLGIGAAAKGVRGLITSLEQVRAAGRLAPTSAVGRVTAQEAERQALAFLVRGLAATPEVQEFASEALGPLLAHDASTGAGHSGDLVRVLQAYLQHPTNRSLAAQHARLSRSVFYQRIALIEEILGVDLADGPTIATLTVALLAHEPAAGGGSRRKG